MGAEAPGPRAHGGGFVLGEGSALHRALRRMAGLVFLLVFWVLAGACQRHGVGPGVGGFLLFNSSSSSSVGGYMPEIADLAPSRWFELH